MSALEGTRMRLIALTVAMGLMLVALVEGLGATSTTKQIIYPIAPVYCTEVRQVAILPLWRLPHNGTVFAMEIYTDEQHIADWFALHLDPAAIWLELEPVRLEPPHGLAWRVHSARHYNTETGATISSVETRRKG